MLDQKFKDYIEKELRFVPNCDGKKDLHDELLDELMTIATEVSDKEEEEIFKICTSRLRDFSADIRYIKQDPIVKIKDGQVMRDILIMLSAALLSVIIYLTIGFCGGDWGVSAIVIFPGLAGLFFVYAVTKVLIYNVKNHNHKTSGVIMCSYVLIFTLVLYFTLTFGFDLDPAKTWCIYTIMPALFGLVHIVTQLGLRKKMVSSIAIMIEVILISVAMYLAVSCIVWSFHPYWLIIVFGVLLDGIFLAYIINKKLQQNKK
ncbi:MAG: hypothetical protein R3Y23_00215 [Bacillota bacterium]